MRNAALLIHRLFGPSHLSIVAAADLPPNPAAVMPEKLL